MKAVKTPKIDSLRGIGVNKLGWGEGSRNHNTVKKVISTFENEKFGKDLSKRKTICCPICNATLKTNNQNKVPDHRRKNYFGFSEDNICPGSYSKQKSDVTYTEKLNSIGVNGIIGLVGTNLNVGEKYVIDFTREILKPYSDVNDVVEVVVEDVTKIVTYNNNGDIFYSQVFIKFSGIEKQIPSYELSSNNIIKA